MDIQIKVGIIVINERGDILLIKEKLEKNSISLWNIVKGSYQGGETIMQAAIRECMEEASANVKLLSSLGTYVAEEQGKIRAQFNFLARANSDIIALALEKDQQSRGEAIEDTCWFTRENVGKIGKEEFASLRAYQLIQDWLSGKEFPIDSIQQVSM
ncbi:MAG: NUDIX hydrolase [Candidatus Moraniibacteriota bacterium]|nr:MAG: NUDIX hydrolase [Candidatus Moranbacteria bacterium]